MCIRDSDLDSLDDTKAKEAVMLDVPYTSIFGADRRQYKWSVFRDLPAAEMFDTVQKGVFPFLKTLGSSPEGAYSKYMDDAIFMIPTPQKLSQIVDQMDALYASGLAAPDIRGMCTSICSPSSPQPEPTASSARPGTLSA